MEEEEHYQRWKHHGRTICTEIGADPRFEYCPGIFETNDFYLLSTRMNA